MLLLRTLTTVVPWHLKFWACFWVWENVWNDKLQTGRSTAEGLFCRSHPERLAACRGEGLFWHKSGPFHSNVLLHADLIFFGCSWMTCELLCSLPLRWNQKLLLHLQFISGGRAPCFPFSKLVSNLSSVVCTVRNPMDIFRVTHLIPTYYFEGEGRRFQLGGISASTEVFTGCNSAVSIWHSTTFGHITTDAADLRCQFCDVFFSFLPNTLINVYSIKIYFEFKSTD